MEREPDNKVVKPTTFLFESTLTPKTNTERPLLSTYNYNKQPTIVVLGATGKIGSRIVKQLMNQSKKLQVIVICRNYKKTKRVLKEVLEDTTRPVNTKKNKPQLKLIVADLVPKEEVYGYTDDDENNDNYAAAVSASKFYKNGLQQYLINDELDNDDDDNDPNELLKETIQNATVIISAIGTSASSEIPFQNYILTPWRIFRTANKWCRDSSHSYYVNYAIMKKVVDYAQEEQQRRHEQWQQQQQQQQEEQQDNDNMKTRDKEDNDKELPKIRIVRISDLAVSNSPWNFNILRTNILRNLVIRDQAKCEKLLSRSPYLDTIILRPGTLINDARNSTTTFLQVDVSGTLPVVDETAPYVGRCDVANLATIAAMANLEPEPKNIIVRDATGTIVTDTTNTETNEQSQSSTKRKRKWMNLRNRVDYLSKATTNSNAMDRKVLLQQIKKEQRQTTTNNNNNNDTKKNQAKHWTVAMRWAGGGLKKDGYDTAKNCMEHIIKEEAKLKRTEKRKLAVRNTNVFCKYLQIPLEEQIQRIQQHHVKPYGVFVLISMLCVVYPLLWFMMYHTIGKKILQPSLVKHTTTWIGKHISPIWTFFRRSNTIASSPPI